MKQVRLVRPVEPHCSYVALSTHVFIILKVLSIFIPQTQIYHKLDKTLKFANTLDNHEDFHGDVTGQWVKVRREQTVWK